MLLRSVVVLSVFERRAGIPVLTCCTGRLVCLFFNFVFIYFACVCVSHGIHVEVRGQFVAAGSLSLPMSGLPGSLLACS